MKTCIKEEYAPQPVSSSTTTNNYTNSQVATTINNTNNNNTTNNNNLVINNHIYYNDHVIQFDDGHITRKDLKRIFNGASVKAIQAIAAYANKLLENTNNVCVRKKYITNAYCDVRTEEGWVCRPDKTVIERISQDIAGSANDKLYDHPDIGSQTVRKDVADIASFDEDVIDKTKHVKKAVIVRHDIYSVVLAFRIVFFVLANPFANCIVGYAIFLTNFNHGHRCNIFQ